MSSFVPQRISSLAHWPIVVQYAPSAAYIAQISSPLHQERTVIGTETAETRAKANPPISLREYLDLTERYLETANVENPILDPIRVRQLVTQAYSNNFKLNIESLLGLLVCANGAISISIGTTPRSGIDPHSDMADVLFQLAEQRLGMAFVSDYIAGAQAMYLCGLFHGCKSQTGPDRFE